MAEAAVRERERQLEQAEAEPLARRAARQSEIDSNRAERALLTEAQQRRERDWTVERAVRQQRRGADAPAVEQETMPGASEV